MKGKRVVPDKIPDFTSLITQTFSPDPGTLLECLAQQLDDNKLSLIAQADYGRDFEQHYTVLRRIREERQVPVPLQWAPKEVLELTQWTNVEKCYTQMGLTQEEGHLIRAFACTVLLIAYSHPADQGPVGTETDTLVQLVESVIALGQEAVLRALQLVGWRVVNKTVDQAERPYFALAILILAVALMQPPLGGAILNQLAEWVMLEEELSRHNLEEYYQTGDTRRWLLYLKDFGQRTNLWRELSRRWLLQPDRPHPAEADESLRLIGTALTWQ